jgi:hypothetical protein
VSDDGECETETVENDITVASSNKQSIMVSAFNFLLVTVKKNRQE